MNDYELRSMVPGDYVYPRLRQDEYRRAGFIPGRAYRVMRIERTHEGLPVIVVRNGMKEVAMHVSFFESPATHPAGSDADPVGKAVLNAPGSYVAPGMVNGREYDILSVDISDRGAADDTLLLTDGRKRYLISRLFLSGIKLSHKKRPGELMTEDDFGPEPVQ